MRLSHAVLALCLLAGCKQPADPATLVRHLQEGDEAQRTAAVERLIALGGGAADVLPEIEKAVLAKDAEVRRAAVAVLATQPDASRGGLLVALGDADPQIREAASRALGEGGGKKAVAGLVERLGDEDFRVSAAAGRALVQIGEPARPALARLVVTGSPELRDRALRALVELGPTAIPDLVAAARAMDPGVRASVIESLIMLKPEADAVLATYRSALGDADGSVRDCAARALQALGADAAPAAPDLVPLLADRDNAGPAAWALRDIGAAAVPTLVQALAHESEAIRRGAAQTLGTLGKDAREAAGPLAHALEDESVQVRREAASALGAIGPSEAVIAALVDRLGDDDETVAHRAGEALRTVPELARESVQQAADGTGPAAERARPLVPKLVATP